MTVQMNDSYKQWQTLSEKILPVYNSTSEAVKARHLVSEMDESSVETLVSRGLKNNGKNFVWRSDPRLRVKSRNYPLTLCGIPMREIHPDFGILVEDEAFWEKVPVSETFAGSAHIAVGRWK